MITKQGTVVKVSGNKTIKVETIRKKAHPKYKKSFRVTKNFLAHDEKNEAKVGDVVSIVQTSPISKRKHWKLAA